MTAIASGSSCSETRFSSEQWRTARASCPGGGMTRRFMDKILLVLMLLGCVASVHADIAADGSNIFTGDSKTVQISTTMAAPTQILTVDNFVTRTWIVNTSTFTMFISTVSTNLTTNSPSIPPCAVNTTCVPWTPDGPIVPYWGAMFAVLSGTATPTGSDSISVLRLK